MVAAAVNERKPKNALTQLSTHLDKLKQQMQLVLPKHMTSDRMARLALTAFNAESKLLKCSFESVAASVMVAAQMGLEIGVGGHGWLVPYGETATFVPGWMGLVELLNRSGRATAWTGAVYVGDSFDWELGDTPYVKHKPTGEKEKLTHVYAIGRTENSKWPIIEVWTMASVLKHRDRYNKVGQKHYSFTNDNNMEMYARKVALLQVLKYLPKSIELQAAVDASYAADVGNPYTVDANCVVLPNAPPQVEQDMDHLANDLAAKREAKKVTPIESRKVEEVSGEEPTPERDDDHPRQDSGGDEEPDIVADYKQQIQACEDSVELRLLEQAIKKSRSLDDDERAFLMKLCKATMGALE